MANKARFADTTTCGARRHTRLSAWSFPVRLDAAGRAGPGRRHGRRSATHLDVRAPSAFIPLTLWAKAMSWSWIGLIIHPSQDCYRPMLAWWCNLCSLSPPLLHYSSISLILASCMFGICLLTAWSWLMIERLAAVGGKGAD
jgi:hypothetical protein